VPTTSIRTFPAKNSQPVMWIGRIRAGAFAATSGMPRMPEHNNRWNPKPLTAYWDDGRLIVHDSNQARCGSRTVWPETYRPRRGRHPGHRRDVGRAFGYKASIKPPAVLRVLHRKCGRGAVTVSSPAGKCSHRGMSWDAALHAAARTARTDKYARLHRSTSELPRRPFPRYSEFDAETRCWPGMMYATPSVRTGNGWYGWTSRTLMDARRAWLWPRSFGMESRWMNSTRSAPRHGRDRSGTTTITRRR